MNMRIMRREYNEVEHQCAEYQVKIKDNEDKIKQNKVLPYLVAHIVEVLEVEPEDADVEDMGAGDNTTRITGKCVIIKTTTRQVIFLDF